MIGVRWAIAGRRMGRPGLAGGCSPSVREWVCTWAIINLRSPLGPWGEHERPLACQRYPAAVTTDNRRRAESRATAEPERARFGDRALTRTWPAQQRPLALAEPTEGPSSTGTQRHRSSDALTSESESVRTVRKWA